MNTADQIKFLLSNFAAQLPLFVVSLVAIAVIVVRWKRAPGGSLWALTAFLLTLLLCLFIPIAQTGVQSWAMRSSANLATRASVFTGLGVAWSVLRSTTYVLLLVAVFAGRPRTSG